MVKSKSRSGLQTQIGQALFQPQPFKRPRPDFDNDFDLEKTTGKSPQTETYPNPNRVSKTKSDRLFFNKGV